MHVLRRLLPVLFVFFLKKNYFNGNLIYVLSSFFLNTMFCLPKNSFRTTLPLFCFITMEEQVSGMMNLSGRRMWYTQVLGSRQNGINSFSYTSLSFPPSYMSFLTLIYIYIYFFLCIYICCEYIRWYAKRFLHPDIVARYDYIFMWDEDLGVDHFDAEEWVYFTLTSIFFFILNNNISLLLQIHTHGQEAWPWDFTAWFGPRERVYMANH